MGVVYWITGLSGAGKTTIGRLFYEKLHESKSNVVFLDGDVLREVFGNDLGHSLADRKKSGMRNAKLCKLLSDQGIDVVCATISMFHDCHKWNRENITNYKEIYIKVPFEILQQRDQKGLYSGALSKDACNVMGIDLQFEEPCSPDITILNDGKLSPEIILQQIINKI